MLFAITHVFILPVCFQAPRYYLYYVMVLRDGAIFNLIFDMLRLFNDSMYINSQCPESQNACMLRA